MEQANQIISKYNIEDTATLKKPLKGHELEELKEAVEQVPDQQTFLIGNRRAFCYLDEIKERLKKLGTLDLSNIQVEKPNEIIAYKETIFTPNETEADYKISQDDDWNKEDYWEIEEYTRQQRERERETMRSDDDYFDNMPSSSGQTTITTSEIIRENRELRNEVENLRAELERMRLENEQKAQIEQSPKK